MTAESDARQARLGEYLVRRAREVAAEAEGMSDELKADLAVLLRRPPVLPKRDQPAAPAA